MGVTHSPVHTEQIRALSLPVIVTATMVALAATIAAGAERWLDPPSLALFFVVPIVVAAIRFGLWASLGAALLSSLAVNFLFVEPRHTLAVARTQDAAALALFASVGAIVSAIAARARSAALQAERRAQQASVLQQLAAGLAAGVSEADAANMVIKSLSEFTGQAAVLIAADDRMWGGDVTEPVRDAARWAMSTKQPFLPSLQAPVDVPWRFWPVQFGGRCEMAIGLPSHPPLPPDSTSILEQIAAQAGVAMERARVAREADAARIEVERERLKSELLAGVSHDLRTPLASLVFTLQSLQRFYDNHTLETRTELLFLAETEARRLADMVDALLDASRIGRDGAPVHLESAAPADLVAAALDAAPAAHRARIAIDVDRNLPRVRADPALTVRALANVIANALLYGGDKPVHVRAKLQGDALVFEVSDRGDGLGSNPDRLFGMFVRGASGDGRKPGLGLGLTIARKLVEAQGASISGENGVEGGAIFSLRFQLASDADGG